MGYLASRIPVHVLLHLRHPEAEDPSAEHPWCAWDICEGGLPCLAPPLALYLALAPLLSEVLPSTLDFCLRGSKISGLERSGENWKDCVRAVGFMASLNMVLSAFSLGRETWLQDGQGCAERRVQSGQQPPAAGAGRPPQPVLPPARLRAAERSAASAPSRLQCGPRGWACGSELRANLGSAPVSQLCVTECLGGRSDLQNQGASCPRKVGTDQSERAQSGPVPHMGGDEGMHDACQQLRKLSLFLVFASPQLPLALVLCSKLSSVLFLVLVPQAPGSLIRRPRSWWFCRAGWGQQVMRRRRRRKKS